MRGCETWMHGEAISCPFSRIRTALRMLNSGFSAGESFSWPAPNWFSCVLGAAHGMPWFGPVVVAAVIVLHLARVSRPAPELKLIGIAAALGLVADSLLLASGWLYYPSGSWIPGLAPYWIVAMWALFATTLNVSMRWLRASLPLALVFGAVGGPLSYAAGARLGGLEWVSPAWALGALAVLWAIATPLLVLLSSRYDGVRAVATPSYVQSDWRVSNHA